MDRASSWTELHEWLFAESWHEPLKRFRSTFAFRGIGVAGHRFVTSLARLGGDYALKEQHLIRNFRKYARRSVISQDSMWNWLALAKHHGLPTRLLDWTFSPYVALHFATASLADFDLDGEILAVDFAQANRLLPSKLRRLLDAEGSDVFTAEMLGCAAQSLRELDGLSSDPFLLFLEPPSLDDRIVNQNALFSLMSTADAALDDWLEAHRDLHRRIVLPASLKWEVRDKLDQANITERVLFPGLDGLSAWLRRYYSEREIAAETRREVTDQG